MAWRFKASKYKNAAPIVPKPEACIRDITVGSYQTYGNNIAASAAFMAFNVDHNGMKRPSLVKLFAVTYVFYSLGEIVVRYLYDHEVWYVIAIMSLNGAGDLIQHEYSF